MGSHRDCGAGSHSPGRLVPLLLSSLLALQVLAPTLIGVAMAMTNDLDPTFGDNGIVRLDLGSSERTQALLLEPDGKLVVAVSGGREKRPIRTRLTSSHLTRLNPDGSLDATFGDGGKVVADRSTGNAQGVVRQPDGAYVVGLRGITCCWRLRSGSARTGPWIPPSAGTAQSARPDRDAATLASLIVLPNGELVAAWTVLHPSPTTEMETILTQYSADGGLIQEFGDAGSVRVRTGLTKPLITSLLALPDGMFLAGRI